MTLTVFLATAAVIFTGASNYCSAQATRGSAASRDASASSSVFNAVISTGCQVGLVAQLLMTTS